MYYPKVLLAAPINVVKEYCLYDWLEAIKQLTYPVDIFLVDNSQTPLFSEKIRQMGFDCVHEPPAGRETRYIIASSMERIRTKFLAGEYDHLFHLECDIFPPNDIVERLLAHEKDVVGTTYWTFHGYNTQLQLLSLYHNGFKGNMLEYKSRYMSFAEAQLFMDGKCKTVFANGIGCILIRRWVLEQIAFRIQPDDTGHADSFFHQDLWLASIDNFVDTSIIPRHRNSDWNTIIGDTGHKRMAINKGAMELKK